MTIEINHTRKRGGRIRLHVGGYFFSDSPAASHPVQSPAFRVLQKMTSHDGSGDQARRLQMSEDDRALMNRLRAQGKRVLLIF